MFSMCFKFLIFNMSYLRNMGLNNWVDPRNPSGSLPVVITFRADSRKTYSTSRTYRGVTKFFSAEGYASEKSRISAVDAKQKADSVALSRAMSNADGKANAWVERQRNKHQASANVRINLGGGNVMLQGGGNVMLQGGGNVMLQGGVPVMIGGGVPAMINGVPVVIGGGRRVRNGYRGAGMGRIVNLPFPPPSF